ncbi:MAG: DUF167 domain-containing protein [Anaerolineae bacterium]|nr:DUF167 domain-containing protein [Anaerolineae bacterium]
MPAPNWLAVDEASIILTVRVVPRAHKSEIAGVQGEALRVRLAAPPVEGAANRALVAFLADCLSVRPQQVRLEAGERSRQKRVRVVGLTAAQALERLLPRA